ncbi:MAG: DUF357 domain-containing protein [archaeon]
MKTARDKFDYCRKITEECIRKAEALDENGKTLLKWAKDYYNDAAYYSAKGDSETALEAVAYAHGFIDAGVLLGHLRIDNYHLEKKK